MSLTTFLKPLPNTRLTLRPDQEDAVSRIVDELKFSDRTQAVMACGTGKTVTAQRAAERIVEGKTDPTVLIAVPNLVLVDQMISDWRSQMLPGQEFAVLPVNSRTTVKPRQEGIDEDEIFVDIAGVTDNPETIAAFLTASGRKLIVTTYQSMRHVADALTLVRQEVPGFEMDLVIADEAHRTAGQLKIDAASAFKVVLDNSLIPAAKRLFMTATPRISKLSKSEKDTASASMGNPDVYGDRALTRSLRWAISNELLAPYRAYIVQIADNELQSVIGSNPTLRMDSDAVEARHLAAAIALVKSAATNKLGGIVTYHSRIEGAQKFVQTLRAVVEALPASEKPAGNLIVGHINGSTPQSEREAILGTLDSANRQPGDWAVVTNCSCLTEGVNVPAMDAIMFVDPRRSVVANVQAIGRPLRRDPRNPGKIASILLPVFIGDAESPEEALQSGAFEGVYEVIKSLKDVDDALSEMFIDELVKNHDGEDRETGHDIPIELVHPSGATADLAFWGKWHESVRLHLLGETTDWWEKAMAALRSFVAREGHALVPRYHQEHGLALGHWVNKRRGERYQLDRAKQEALEALPGWTWSQFTSTWEKYRTALVAFIAREGHSMVPFDHKEDGLDLGKWVGRQRSRYASSAMPQSRIKRLEAVDEWVWSVLDEEWIRWTSALSTFVAREGHARVPNSHVEGDVKLGAHVKSARSRRNQLGIERVEHLESYTGWEWDMAEFLFQEGLAHLKKFAAEHGHARVLFDWVQDGYALGRFVMMRRTRRDKLTQAQREQLEAVPGWVWSAQAALFEDALRALAAYHQRTGTTAIPLAHCEGAHGTGKWAATARRKLVEGQFTRDQVASLDAIGTEWRKGRRAPWESEQDQILAA